MILKPLEQIAEDDLLALITNAVSEGRTIDYKRELPGNSDGDKKEFLADVSSFANTSGGDLVFGMDEAEGLPTQLAGFQSANTDAEILRLENILAAGLDPRIRYAARIVPCQNGVKALVIRVERSWSGPRRVVFKGHDRFYGRTSAGKYSLDVNQLRSAFTFASTVTERIRPHCFQVLQQIGANVPVLVALSLIGTRGLEMGVDYFEQSYPIKEDIFTLPETVVQDFSTPVGTILKPLFDLVWNACGHPASKNFDAEGNWVNRR